jgi:DNA topoisomerase-1
VLAAVALAVSEGAASPAARKRAVTRAVKEVAHYLGNTPAVARSAYIDPRVIERYDAGETIAGVLADMPTAGASDHTLLHADVEDAVIGLLTGEAGDRPETFAANA